ncbi:H2O-forming NADH oxidase [Enterococcus xiangfangensis]|uniref:NADH oxidase n=1 Tax=Enterococcus xiangfangensis TaxID=1296537 RepID=A0ABU3F908_9ENTE|nr:FAD-dependent oxidoreductase [Enterococcus xiangfangensis]MBM7712822.1 NADPH-dependent 2,4-dienoyl-CoA reductase/sulfur reductase-like enzyme [Enterococcus xiangfangensis]MDT2758180.1 FAD-dependent oxidoreductase [Enterococcus xiangfangensis]NBK09145.1 NADH oxidase [Enterococcus asini]
MTKTVIIGTNHAGIAAANTLLDNYPDQEVVMIDRNSNLSYLGCGTALWVGRQIDDYQGLFYTNKADFEAKGAKIYMETSVDRIDFSEKKVHCVQKDGKAFIESYDKLILATGSRPIAPKVPGHDLDGIHFLKLFQEGQAVDAEISKDSVKKVAVIGAGYIGVEIAEAAKRRGKEVLLFDAADRSLPSYYDKWFTDEMDKNLADHGIETHFGDLVKEYKGSDRVNAIVADSGEYQVDMVINAIGFGPNAELAKDHLELFQNGAYLVDRHQQTSDPDVYAVGDCATIYSNALEKMTYIALASNAVRSGIVAGHNVGGTPLEAAGVQGSNGISIWGLNLVSTGLSVTAAEKNGVDVKYTDFEDLQKPGFIKGENDTVKIRIVYEASSRRIVGAQLSSREDISMGIHMFSLAIAKHVTIDELKLLDIFFLPHFNQPYNYITMAALSAE